MLIKSFATSQSTIRGEDFRFYVFSNHLYLLCLIIHVCLIAFFYFIDVYLLSIFNVFSSLIFAGNLLFNRKGKLKLAVHLSIMEITVHAALATLCLGWESNFSFYSIAICSVIMFSTFLQMRTKIIEVILSTLLYLITFIYLVNHAPLYKIDSLILAAIGFINILVIIPLITYTFYSFYKTTEILNQRLKSAAEIDGLTGIYNRRFFNEYSDIEIKRVSNERKYLGHSHHSPNFALAIIDMDNFKHINDTYGHLAGDQVLIQTVKIIQQILFGRDVLCRYGGEEFVVLFTKTSKEGALVAVEKIRKEIDQAKFAFTEHVQDGHVTLSIGFASFDEVQSENIHDLLKLADDRLYQAKSSGKNKLVH